MDKIIKADELIINTKKLVSQNEEKEECAEELLIANKELAFQKEEKNNRVTETKKLKEDLVASEIRFRTLMENNHDAITLRDENFSIIYRNPSAIRILGWATKDEKGRSLMDNAHPDDKDEIEKALQDVLHNQGKPVQLNFRSRHKDGHYIWVEGMMMNMLHDKNVNAYVSNFRDITERKKAETALLELNEQLRNPSSHVETVRENERTSIAREVHDELGQQMTSLKMDIAWISNKTKDKRPEVLDKIAGMMEMTNEAIRTIRKIVIQLRPGILDDLGLVAALEWQAKEFEKRNGIACKFSASVKNETFSREVNTAIFRIFQESLTNVTRHAQATEVNAHLYEENKSLVLEVSDNGIGISDERKNNKISFGLLGMKERAAILQGSFDIRKLNGSGTVVQLKIPI